MYRKYKSVAVLLKPAHHEAHAVHVLLVEAALHNRRQRLVDLHTHISFQGRILILLQLTLKLV